LGTSNWVDSQYNLTIGSNLELAQLLSNCESPRLSFSYLESKLRCISNKRSYEIFIFKWSHKPSQLWWRWTLKWFIYLEHILVSRNLNNKYCHTYTTQTQLFNTEEWPCDRAHIPYQYCSNENIKSMPTLFTSNVEALMWWHCSLTAHTAVPVPTPKRRITHSALRHLINTPNRPWQLSVQYFT
jgi:hypothetical protein